MMRTYRVGTPEEFTIDIPDGYQLVSDEQHQRLQLAALILSDLDRSTSGRHLGDVEGQDPTGRSQGNQFLSVGERIGTTMSGHAIIVPLKPWIIESWIAS